MQPFKSKTQLIYVMLIAVIVILIMINFLAYFQASKFTHFDISFTAKTQETNEFSFRQKLSALLFGVDNPRPANMGTPSCSFETVRLKSNKEIECWNIRCDSAKGTVILFHGYSGEKSSMLDKAEVFIKLGYNILLVDFMGSGGSEGNQTTIGFYEAEEVKTAFDYIKQQGENNIILFGTSMGAVAVMKAENDYKLNAKSIIIECPFATMLETVEARFKNMHIPAFPLANLLVFWGGFQNGFNAFSLKPVEYARAITCPTLLLYGGQDVKVHKNEIDRIFSNLKGYKQLKLYPEAGHENYLIHYRNEWTNDVSQFINSVSKNN